MGFMDFLGGMAGDMAARVKEVDKYKSEYQSYTDSQLETEYKRVYTKYGEEFSNRKSALRILLKERGYTD